MDNKTLSAKKEVEVKQVEVKQVEEFLTRLHRNIDRVQGSVNSLEERLQGVLTDAPPVCAPGDECCLVPVAQEIRNAGDRTNDIEIKLASILDRLEL